MNSCFINRPVYYANVTANQAVILLFSFDFLSQKHASFKLFLSRYREAAAIFALTQASFEEVALKFIYVSEQEPLKVSLVEKLNHMDNKVVYYIPYILYYKQRIIFLYTIT